MTVSEQFLQLQNGKPMWLALSVRNTTATQQSINITVEVKGTTPPPGFLNVNNDTASGNPYPSNSSWTCNNPAEIASPTTDSFFHCSAVIPANATSTTMVTTGSSFKAAGNTITITSTVNDVNGSTANLPAPATAQGTVV